MCNLKLEILIALQVSGSCKGHLDFVVDVGRGGGGSIKKWCPIQFITSGVTLNSDPVENDSPGHFSTLKVTPRIIFQR